MRTMRELKIAEPWAFRYHYYDSFHSDQWYYPRIMSMASPRDRVSNYSYIKFHYCIIIETIRQPVASLLKTWIQGKVVLIMTVGNVKSCERIAGKWPRWDGPFGSTLFLGVACVERWTANLPTWTDAEMRWQRLIGQCAPILLLLLSHIGV